MFINLSGHFISFHLISSHFILFYGHFPRLAAWPDQVAFEIVERTVVQVLGTDHRSNRSLVIPTFAQFRTGTARTS